MSLLHAVPLLAQRGVADRIIGQIHIPPVVDIMDMAIRVVTMILMAAPHRLRPPKEVTITTIHHLIIDIIHIHIIHHHHRHPTTLHAVTLTGQVTLHPGVI